MGDVVIPGQRVPPDRDIYPPLGRWEQLGERMQAANVAADEAMASYAEHKTRITRGKTAAQQFIACRDDVYLAELASACAFQTALVNRLALTILAESALWRHDV